ncbi:MAG: FdhF/YdeP family oxidoreductase [Isosphaerales bacterium]
MKPMKNGGGWAAIKYSLRMANRVGWWRLWKAMSAKNACKTCALGMGGQSGGMRNEAGHWPEVCKKSLQAMVADMQGALRPGFFRTVSLDQLKTLTPRELEWSGRLTQPLYAGPVDTHFRAIPWDEALARLADRLKRQRPDESFFYASGRSSNEAGFLLQLFARLYGTNYVNNCSYYCHQASGVGLGRALGTGTATVTLEDVEHANLFFLIGGNPASNHPRLLRTLMQIRRNGGHVIVINPVKEVGLVNFRVPSDVRSLLFGSRIASLYVQPHIGGDIALLTGVAKLLIERNQLEADFIAGSTEGFDEFRRQVESTDWTSIEHAGGVGRATVERIADLYATARNAVFGWTMGITHQTHGVSNVRMIVNLALLRGMAGRPGAGLLPIRGHSNVQGIGSVGVAPALKQAILDRLETLLGVKLPAQPGLDTMACMHAAAEGRVKSALCLGGNLYGSNPDAAFAGRALNNLELVTYLSTTLNTGHVWGRGRETLVLPVRARDEEGPTTQESMFNYVRLSDGGPARYEGPRSEVSIIAELGGRVLGDGSPVRWNEMHECLNIRHLIARAVPGFESLATIDQTRQEFQIPGRTFHARRFATPNGKAQFAAVPIPPPAGRPDELRLMTIRSEGQFNTVVYEDEDIYRGQDRRDVILMNAEDLQRRGLEPDQMVCVRSAAGVMHGIHARSFDIKAGNAAMYFPEANVLVPATTDPDSKTPAFKCVLIALEPEPARSGSLGQPREEAGSGRASSNLVRS